jgi:catechol 2,3-dioxygenase-like lactoylglutathione lyase family enzyme
MTVSSLIRAALFVADLDRASIFYSTLGLTQVYYEGELDQTTTNRVLRTPETTITRCRILKKPDTPNFGMIGLFELTNPAPPSVRRESHSLHVGEATLVFYCDSLDATLEAARAAGAQSVHAPELLVMPHRPDGQRETLLRDPDGVLINLIEKDDLEEAFKTIPILDEIKAAAGGKD